MAHVISARPDDNFQALEERLATIGDVYSAASVLAWDRQTYMPEGGVRSRAEQLASLTRLAHEMLVRDWRAPRARRRAGARLRRGRPPAPRQTRARTGEQAAGAPGGRDLTRDGARRAGLDPGAGKLRLVPIRAPHGARTGAQAGRGKLPGRRASLRRYARPLRSRRELTAATRYVRSTEIRDSPARTRRLGKARGRPHRAAQGRVRRGHPGEVRAQRYLQLRLRLEQGPPG